MTDLISREDAEMCLTADITNMTIEEYISMVGDRLNELPSIQPKPKTGHCKDCISRQAVDELSKELVHTTRDKADFLCNFWERLQKLPPVNPQEPILDKIRAEMLEEMLSHSGTGEEVIQAYADGLKKGLEFIDKHKAESEE